jgi:hypothetical protein
VVSVAATLKIYIRKVHGSNWLPLWSIDQSSWLQIQRPGFNSRRYHILWEVVGLEQGPLSLVNTTEELLERIISGSCLEIREYGRRNPSRWPCDTIYPQKLVLISPTSCDRSVSIVRWWTKATELLLFMMKIFNGWWKFPYPIFRLFRLPCTWIFRLWLRTG